MPPARFRVRNPLRNKSYLYGSHFLPHDAMATMHSGKTFLTEQGEVGTEKLQGGPRTHDIWIGINRLRQILPRFTFRIPASERGLEAVSNYHTVRTTSTAGRMNLSMKGRAMWRPL